MNTYAPALLLVGCAGMLVLFAFGAAPTDGAWLAAIVLAAMVAGAAVLLALETYLERRRAVRRNLWNISEQSLRRLDREDDR
jgi:hypothetical protein